MKSFTETDPKSTKNTVKPSVFFALLESAHVTALHKMLVKLTPESALGSFSSRRLNHNDWEKTLKQVTLKSLLYSRSSDLTSDLI